MMAVALAEQLEKLLHRKIDATVAWDFANIQVLSAFLANDTMVEGMVAQTVIQHEPIAVIGMGCRFPGANSIAAYWELLREWTACHYGVACAKKRMVVFGWY